MIQKDLITHAIDYDKVEYFILECDASKYSCSASLFGAYPKVLGKQQEIKPEVVTVIPNQKTTTEANRILYKEIPDEFTNDEGSAEITTVFFDKNNEIITQRSTNNKYFVTLS